MPGLTSTKMYRPSLLVLVVRAMLVVVSVSVTAASGTTAPDWSVMTPATVPVDVDCAHAGRLPAPTANIRTRTSFIPRVCITFLLTERLNFKRLPGNSERETSRPAGLWNENKRLIVTRHLHRCTSSNSYHSFQVSRPKSKTEECKNGQQDEPTKQQLSFQTICCE